MKIMSWGANTYGQLGHGIQSEQCNLPTEITAKNVPVDPSTIISIVGGGGHSLLLDKCGDVYSCGWNSRGQCGMPVDSSTMIFTKISYLEEYNVAKISCGWDTSMALTQDGTLLTWGSNAYGQLGVPRNKVLYSDKPLKIEVPRIQTMSVGLRHAALVSVEGKVFIHGEGRKGQLGLVDENKMPIQNKNEPTEVVGLTNVQDVACGQHHTVALTKTGRVFAWGDNKHGQLGLDPTIYPNIPVPTEIMTIPNNISLTKYQLMCGWTHTALVTDEGTLINWGRNTYGELGCFEFERPMNWKPLLLQTVTNIKQLAVGSEHNITILGLEIHSPKVRSRNTMPFGVEGALSVDQNECAAPELSFREVPETPATRKKVQEIENVLSQDPVDIKKLKTLAMSEGGLIHDNIRKRAWSKLVGIDKIPPLKPLTDKELEANEEYNQVVLDVNRSLKRFPPGIPYEQRVVLQDQLTRLIMRVIIKHPHLKYYQGYHDVAVTVLLVVGEEAAFPIMEKLSTNHLNECMADTMDKTSHLLNYIYPLLERMHSTLFDFMERSGCGTLFCLPWYLTWYGHNLNHYTDVVRLYDYFMSTEKLLPLYLAAAIVVYRKDEIFNVECDMPYVHSLLSNIPDDLPFEKLLKEASELYKSYPPESIEKEANERTKLSRLQMRGSKAVVRRRTVLKSIFQLMPRYSLVLATATLMVGLYAYIRTASARDPDSLLPFR